MAFSGPERSEVGRICLLAACRSSGRPQPVGGRGRGPAAQDEL